MTKRNIDAILIAGPTASGKSVVALELAKALNGLVINADSMQVYRDLAIITARPSEAEQAGIPHTLYGTVDGAVNYSVGHYLKDFEGMLRAAREGGRLPIVAGGTGLYFKALLEGLSSVPPVPESVRTQVRALAEEIGPLALHTHLARHDPEGAARLRPSDSLRVQRALEVWQATGRPLAEFQAQRLPGLLAGLNVVRIFLDADRDTLRARIDARFVAMMAAGALEEVDVLRRRRLDPLLPVMRAHGVPGLIDHLEGGCSLEEAIDRGQSDTRRYAKRQFTWFRHQMTGWDWMKPGAAVEAVLGAVERK